MTFAIVIDPPQPGASDDQQIDSVTADSSRGDYLRLEYPKGPSPSERADTQGRLARLPPELDQQLLDELATRLKAGTIRVSPLVYLAGLIRHGNAGRFVPEAALRVADERERRHRNAAYLQRLRTSNDVPIAERTEVEDSPLAKRLAEIRLRSLGRDKDG